MRSLRRIFICALFGCAPTYSFADVIGRQDFDGGAINLITSSVPTLDGGAGDSFAVGATQAWPTTGGTPFALVDNTTSNVGDTTAFANDNEGIFGGNSNFANNFLGISDTRSDGAVFFGTPVTATWTFDISGATGLSLSIDMGSMEGANGLSYSADTLFTFSYSIDGGASSEAFRIAPGGAFNYRPLDNGVVASDPTALNVTGVNAVTKLSAQTGAAALDTFLDKGLVSNGKLDTFTTSLPGTGSQLTLTLNAYIPFEAAAFDNIQLDGAVAVPEPASMTLLSIVAASSGIYIRRRRQKTA